MVSEKLWELCQRDPQIAAKLIAWEAALKTDAINILVTFHGKFQMV